MKTCPYCLAEVADEARKCKHCGEWVVTPPADQRVPDDADRQRREAEQRRRDEEQRPLTDLGRAANRYVEMENTKSIVGGIVFVIVLVFIFIPFACSVTSRTNGPSFPGVPSHLVR